MILGPFPQIAWFFEKFMTNTWFPQALERAGQSSDWQVNAQKSKSCSIVTFNTRISPTSHTPKQKLQPFSRLIARLFENESSLPPDPRAHSATLAKHGGRRDEERTKWRVKREEAVLEKVGIWSDRGPVRPWRPLPKWEPSSPLSFMLAFENVGKEAPWIWGLGIVRCTCRPCPATRLLWRPQDPTRMGPEGKPGNGWDPVWTKSRQHLPLSLHGDARSATFEFHALVRMSHWDPESGARGGVGRHASWGRRRKGEENKEKWKKTKVLPWNLNFELGRHEWRMNIYKKQQ